MTRVRIYQPSQSAMQSANGKGKKWLLEFDKLAMRKPEDLMGWTSSQDTLNQVQLGFECQDDAVKFAQENGWEYIVLKPRSRRIKPRNYGDNFIYRPAEESGS